MRYLVAIALGAALGLASARFLFVGSALSLIPWALAALALSVWCARVQALGVGAVYGFVLAFVFMVAGYSGSTPLTVRLPFFALLGLIGAVCGLVLAWLGATARYMWFQRAARG